MSKERSESAFPGYEVLEDYFSVANDKTETHTVLSSGGMTLREHAAIELRIPDSGLPWLDKMIARAERRDIAVKVLQGCLANPEDETYINTLATGAYEAADTMIAKRNKN